MCMCDKEGVYACVDKEDVYACVIRRVCMPV